MGILCGREIFIVLHVSREGETDLPEVAFASDAGFGFGEGG